MLLCSVCGKDTILLVKGVPLCPKCDDEREARNKPEAAVVKTRDQAKSGKTASLPPP